MYKFIIIFLLSVNRIDAQYFNPLPVVNPVIVCDETTSFQCLDGTCITLHWRCDTEKDCPDGSDEQTCESSLTNQYTNTISVPEYSQTNILPTCPEGYYYCNDRCVQNIYFRCNDIVECRGATDELNCENVCTGNQLSCGINGGCYEIWKKCDGIPDCYNGLDETNCGVLPEPIITGCTKNQITCFTGECLDVYELCDGHNNCLNGEDEFACDFVREQREDYQCLKRCYGIPMDKEPCDGVLQTTTARPVTVTPELVENIICPLNTTQIERICISIHVLPPKNWHDARIDCIRRGGVLLELPSARCFIRIVEFLNGSVHSTFPFYVGANDLDQEDYWIWDATKTPVLRETPMWLLKLGDGSGTSGSLFVQQPAGGRRENCGILSNCPFMYLNDVECEERNPYICEFKPEIFFTAPIISGQYNNYGQH